MSDPAGRSLHIVRGRPDDAELAAVLVALLARPAADPVAVPRPRWGRPSVPAPLPRPGPGAWRASAAPTR